MRPQSPVLLLRFPVPESMCHAISVDFLVRYVLALSYATPALNVAASLLWLPKMNAGCALLGSTPFSCAACSAATPAKNAVTARVLQTSD